MTRSPVLGLVALAALAHGLGLAGGFVYDDHRFVEHNAALASATIGELILDPATHTADTDRDVYRPIRALTHAFDRQRWGLEPFGFHLHSLWVHLANVALGFLLLRRLLPDAGDGPPLLGALTLAVHPLGVETVGWISSRGDLYAVGLGLLALLCVIPPRAATGGTRVVHASAGGLLWGCVLALLATLSKEAALVLPGVVLAHRRLSGSRGLGGTLALSIGVLLALGLRHVALSGASPIQTAPHGGDGMAQAGWALFGLGTLLRHLLWPLGLSVDYPQELWAAAGPAWAAAATWIGLASITAVVLGMRRPRLAAPVFLASWCLLAYLPSSSLLVTLRSLVADRYAYPALLPAGALLGLGIGSLSRAVPRGPTALGLVALALSAWWVPLSIQRTAVFADDTALWADVLTTHPGSVRAQLGMASSETDTERVRARLEEAVRQAQGSSDGRLLAVALSQRGAFALRQDQDPEDAVRWLSAALLLLDRNRDRDAPGPEEAGVVVDLAEALALSGRDGDAAKLVGEALGHHLATERVEPASVAALMLQRARLAMRFAVGIGTAEAAAEAEVTLREAETTAPEHPGVRELRRAWTAWRSDSAAQFPPSSSPSPMPPRSP